jgi:hypothetical protein
MLAEESVIERNDIGVVPGELKPPGQPEGDPDPTDPCVDLEKLYGLPGLGLFADHVFGVVLPVFPAAPFKALGGIQIVAGAERVKVLENTIRGGAGNGILLGGIIPVPAGPIFLLAEQRIESAGDRIQGFVVGADASPIAGVTVLFRNAAGEALTAVSGSGGFYSVRARPDTYQVVLGTPAFSTKDISVTNDSEFGRFHRLTLAQAADSKAEDALAFLYEIQIDRNDITFMGLCGIGYPIPALGPIFGPGPASAVLSTLGNPVLGLGIHRNHIRECFQNIFDDALRSESNRRGFGGISLGFCEDVVVSSNRIERNGRSHINPVCGIFILAGERVDIHHNHINENGPFVAVIRRGLDSGIRGGIVLSASSFGIEALVAQQVSLDAGRHAARIHDNVIYQPVGHALRLLVIGPASLCSNFLSSELNGPEALERLAGTTFVLAAGAGRLPAGVTLFSQNQSRLGAGAASFTSQIIWTTDDIGFDGNQSVSLTNGIALTGALTLFVNTFLLGRTLRANDGRFKEPGGRQQAFILSLLTRTSLLNNTNDNQGDHCILAFNTAPGRAPNQAGNQVVDSAVCRSLTNSVASPVSAFVVTAGNRS